MSHCWRIHRDARSLLARYKASGQFGQGIANEKEPFMRTSLFTPVGSEQAKREQAIERLAREVGQLIRSAEPETQEELREAASALMREEASAIREAGQLTRRRPMNPLAAGLGLLVVGASLALVFPPVGLTLILFAIIGIVWGSIITYVKT
jgi:Flp pilus assembly protein TadB